MSSRAFGPFLIDLRERVLRRDGQPVSLTPKTFDVLAALVEEPGRLVSKDELLQKVWPDTFVEESNLAYHVFALRKALGDTAATPRYIETIPKRGYRFAAPLAAPPPVDTPAVPAVTVASTAHPSGETASARPAHSTSSTEPAGALPFSRRWAFVALAPVLGVMWYSTGPSWRTTGDPEATRALPLTSLVGVVRSPSLSPDGAYVVFTWNGERQDNQDVYVQQIGAGSPLRLTSDPANDYSPSWSPDGRAIAFLRRMPTGRGSEVRLIAPLGGSERKVADVEPGAPLYRPLALGWCPDSACIVTTDTAGPKQPDGVVAINVETGEKRLLTKPDGLAADVDPAISPDGRHLIFRRDTTPFSGTFYRQPLRDNVMPDGPAVALTPTVFAGKPVWMPDSRDVLFPHRGGLWRLDALRGGPAARLPYVGQDGASPVVARMDEGRLRLIYARSFADTNVWRVDWQPGSPAVAPGVAISSTRRDDIPNLLPDGRRLAFLSDRSGDWQIWTAGLDGADAVPLTSMEFRSMPGFPRWSPDGTRIAFHGDPQGRPEVLVAPVRGGDARSLTSSLTNGGFPSFSRDGRWIYFCVFNDAREGRIWRIPAGGGTAVQVTQHASTQAIESRDGRDLFYNEATNGSSAVWRLPLAGGPPEKILDRVASGLFDVTDGGIFYIERVVSEPGALERSDGGTRLQYYDFATRRSTIVAQNLGNLGFGLTASPDGRTVFFSRVDASTDELMIVDGFR